MSASNGLTGAAARMAEIEPPSHNVKIVDGDRTRPTKIEQATADGAELRAWWLAEAEVEIARTVPKAVEYGGHGSAVDLIWIGREMAANLGRTEVTDEEATELGIYFYALGKFGRWSAAIRQGKRVSDDTIFDVSVYCRMASRNRQVGGWPFGSDPT
jgi:hypothetical protein